MSNVIDLQQTKEAIAGKEITRICIARMRQAYEEFFDHCLAEGLTIEETLAQLDKLPGIAREEFALELAFLAT